MHFARESKHPLQHHTAIPNKNKLTFTIKTLYKESCEAPAYYYLFSEQRDVEVYEGRSRCVVVRWAFGEMKRILVTGASSGVGQAVALRFARDGHSLYITGRDVARLTQTSDICRGAGAKVVHKGIGDVSVEDVVARHFEEALQAMGGIDVAVLNAGVGRHGLLEDISVENFDLVFNTNVRGVFLWLKKFLPHMKERKAGQIIVISSVAGVQPFARKSVYSASKYAVQGLIECLRAELAGTGVKVATILPGVIATPWWDGPAGYEKGVQEAALTAEDVADNVAFVAYQSETSDIEKIVMWPTSS